jgi:hypothetical protein
MTKDEEEGSLLILRITLSSCLPLFLTFVLGIKAWMGRGDGGAVLGSTGRESGFPL